MCCQCGYRCVVSVAIDVLTVWLEMCCQCSYRCVVSVTIDVLTV